MDTVRTSLSEAGVQGSSHASLLFACGPHFTPKLQPALPRGERRKAGSGAGGILILFYRAVSGTRSGGDLGKGSRSVLSPQ